MSEAGCTVEFLVSEALLISDALGKAVIEVKGNDGIVTLKGMVESEQDWLAAEEIARQQEGVVDVINNLHILNP